MCNKPVVHEWNGNKFYSITSIRIDHKGNKFNSFKELCNHYGQTRNSVFFRIKGGMTLQEALEKPRRLFKMIGELVVNGKTFASPTHARKYYGMSNSYYYAAKKRGLSEVEIFENYEKENKDKENDL